MARTETGGLKDPPGEGIQPTYIKSAVTFSLPPPPPKYCVPKKKMMWIHFRYWLLLIPQIKTILQFPNAFSF